MYIFTILLFNKCLNTIIIPWNYIFLVNRSPLPLFLIFYLSRAFVHDFYKVFTNQTLCTCEFRLQKPTNYCNILSESFFEVLKYCNAYTIYMVFAFNGLRVENLNITFMNQLCTLSFILNSWWILVLTWYKVIIVLQCKISCIL